MKFEKLFNSKFYAFFEMAYRLLVVNLLFILCSVLGLVVFSTIPALIASITVVKSISHDSSFPLVKTYFNIFKKQLKANMLLSLVFLFAGAILLFNTYFFYLGMQEYQALINEIIFNLSLVLDGIFIVSFINVGFIRVYFPNLNLGKTLKYTFVLLKVFPVIFILVFLLVVVTIIVTYVIPYIMVIFGFSVFVWIVHSLLKAKYSRLVAQGVVSLDVSQYQ